MAAHTDLALAQRTLPALKQLRAGASTPAVQLASIKALADEIEVAATQLYGSQRAISDIRTSAWQAVCKVAVTLQDAPGQLGLHWARAIDATQAWIRALER
jgi:hypothetical protein